MNIAAFLPPANADYVRQRLAATKLALASSWNDLESRLSNGEVELALIDPSAEGEMNIAAATRVLIHCQGTPVAAYVTLSNENLKAVLYLSNRGLRDVFLHPPIDEGKRIAEFAHRLSGHRLAYDFLGLFETRLACLEPNIARALKDLFERPHRYETAADIGLESEASLKRVYRAFRKEGLGTPRKFITAAKLLRAYAYLSASHDPIGSVSKQVGYTRPRVLSQQIIDVLGSSPARLRKHANAAEVLMLLVEWIYKPEPGRHARHDCRVQKLSRPAKVDLASHEPGANGQLS